MTDNDVAALRMLLLALRQAALIVIGAIETHLGLERSYPPKHLRQTGQTGQVDR